MVGQKNIGRVHDARLLVMNLNKFDVDINYMLGHCRRILEHYNFEKKD